jgi:dienelactone hydrolase
MPPKTYADLGPYSDLVDVARKLGPLFPTGGTTTEAVRAALTFTVADETPRDLRRGRTWERDGVVGEELSWSVGFGPRAEAFLLKPAGAKGRLPAVIAFYDHGHFKFFGKEKVADGPDAPPEAVLPYRAKYYGDRAYANTLARAGFAVLVHDVFMWGSRKLPLEAMPEAKWIPVDAVGKALEHGTTDETVVRYHGAAYIHENQLAKYLALLGTNLAAVIAYEDRVALNLLAARDDIDAARIGAVGFSGGGLRAALLGATSDRLKARVVTGMMATYEELLDRLIVPHTWMLFPPGFSRIGDVPDLAACAAPKPLLVQYALGDVMFTRKGMRDSDSVIRGYYERAGAPEAYRGAFFDGPHRFDREMQEQAFAWFREKLGQGN